MLNVIKNFVYEHWPLGVAIAAFSAIMISSNLGILHWLAIAIATIIAILIIGWRINESKFDRYLKQAILETDKGYLIEAAKAVDSISIPEVDGFILIPPYKKFIPKEQYKIFLRKTANAYPWEQNLLSFSFGKDISDFIFEIEPGRQEDENHQHFIVRAPRIKSKNGKRSNRYDWGWIYKNSDALKAYFERTFPLNPQKAFRYILGSEGCFQSRTGTKSSWVQGAEYQKCPDCKKSMVQIAQIASYNFGYRDFTIYILGCPNHPKNSATIWQCT